MGGGRCWGPQEIMEQAANRCGHMDCGGPQKEVQAICSHHSCSEEWHSLLEDRNCLLRRRSVVLSESTCRGAGRGARAVVQQHQAHAYAGRQAGRGQGTVCGCCRVQRCQQARLRARQRALPVAQRAVCAAEPAQAAELTSIALPCAAPGPTHHHVASRDRHHLSGWQLSQDRSQGQLGERRRAGCGAWYCGHRCPVGLCRCRRGAGRHL